MERGSASLDDCSGSPEIPSNCDGGLKVYSELISSSSYVRRAMAPGALRRRGTVANFSFLKARRRLIRGSELGIVWRALIHPAFTRRLMVDSDPSR